MNSYGMGSYNVCFSGWHRLVLQLNPGALLFGFLFLLIILLNMLQEAVSALPVPDVLSTHIDPLGQNMALPYLFTVMPMACCVIL